MGQLVRMLQAHSVSYTANNEGMRFIECDYWSGQMMQEFYNELQSERVRIFKT